MQISPISHPLNATVRVPGSKSLTNRVLMIAALAEGTTRLTNALFSDDSKYFANALQTIGFKVELSPDTCEMRITGLGGEIPASQAHLYIGNAGTAARFLSAFLTLGHGEFIIDGDPRMRERPIGDLAGALLQLGAHIQTSPKQTPPVIVNADGLPGGRTAVAGDISSQFLSALLMVAPYARSPVDIHVQTSLNSKPYVDMTIEVMRSFGVNIQREGYSRFTILNGHYKAITDFAIESDASAASYFFAAPAICGGSIRVENATQDSIQGDIHFLEVLAQMGCAISEINRTIEVSGPEVLKGIDVDMRDMPDTAQTLAAIAPFARTPTHIRGIASARVKETDRIAATCKELSRLGVHVDEYPDGMTIYPCHEFQAAEIQTYNDHRMAMAFSLIGLRIPGVTILDPGCVSKTFPLFFQTLEVLR